MKFANPLFLYALFALSIPIIIHLFNFRRYKKIYFSDIRFLKDISEKTKKQSKLKHLLILLARMLGLAFLIFAFSMPFLPEKGTTSKGSEKIVSIYIDNSFSMDAVNTNGRLLDNAKKVAESIAATYSTFDKFQLLTSDFEGKHQRLYSKEDFIRMLEEITLSPSYRSIEDICKRIQNTLQNKSNANKTAYIISDFQKSTAQFNSFNADSSISFILVPVTPSGQKNLYIDSCWLESPVQLIGNKESIHIKIVNRSDNDIENNSVKLFLNNEQKSMASFSVKPNEETVVNIGFFSEKAGINHGKIQISDYPITFDNEYYFTFNAADKFNVLIIKPSDLRNDFSKSLKVLFSDSLFNLTEFEENKIEYSVFSKYSFIVLSGLHEINSGLSTELNKFMDGGGSLFIIPNDDIDLVSYNQLLKENNCGTYAEPDTHKVIVSKIEYRHPLFNGVFEKPPDNIDMPVIKKRYPLQTTISNKEEVLLHLPNNQSYLSLFNSNRSKIYVLGSGLNESSTNFSRHALFVPIIYKMVLLSKPLTPLSYSLGGNKTVELNNTIASGDKIFKLSGENNYEIIPGHRSDQNITTLYFDKSLNRSGNYNLRYADSTITGLSFNYGNLESQTSFYTSDELKETIEKHGLVSFKILDSDTELIGNKIKEIDEGKKLWKWCIVLSLLFFGTEVLLLRLKKSG